VDLCLSKTQSGKSNHYRHVIVFKKLRLKNVFRPYEKTKPAFSNYSSSKTVLEKLRSRDGLLWTVGLTEEIKLCFQMPPSGHKVPGE